MAFNPRAPLMVLMKATYLLPPFSAQWIQTFRQNVLSFRHAKVRRPSTGGLAFNLWVTQHYTSVGGFFKVGFRKPVFLLFFEVQKGRDYITVLQVLSSREYYVSL